jgi:hypothetical protein
MQEDAFVGLFSFFGFGRPNEPMSAVLEVILGVMEDRAKEGRRVATGDKAIKKQVELTVFVLSIFNKLVETEKHSVDHTLQDSWRMG